MYRFLQSVWVWGMVLMVTAMTLRAQDVSIDIPYEKFVLDNGLTLIVSEDHKAPIVAVNVWYHVGSKNEKPGKTGFAHLFEHLMFNGSENYNDDYFGPLDRVGVTDLNGTTWFDRTNYFQNVPSTALDMVLWLESDRMGHLLGAIDQEKLDEQRGVVQNEKRQGENQPYGKVDDIIDENIYPEGHPYSWSTIGSMEDLNAASLEDVQEWFKTYYGAANAVIAVVGDVEIADVKEKVEAYFGDIPSGPPVTRQQAWQVKRTESHRMKTEDRVPQARVYKVWNIPKRGEADLDYLNLVSDVLAVGKTSRFYKRLVYEEQIATAVSASIEPHELGSKFTIRGTAQPGKGLAAVEQALMEELEKFIQEGPTANELKRIKTQYRAGFVRGIERIGGFGGVSDILAQGEVYHGSPEFYKVQLQRTADARAEDLRGAAERWLTSGDFAIEVHPFPDYATVESKVDRSAGVPETKEFPAVSFNKFQRTELSNGLEVILAERHSIPVVQFQLMADAGFAADQFGAQGTASFALSMLDEGTKNLSALEISEQLAQLGATLSTGSNLDQSVVSFSALKENLDASLEIYADVVLNPSFPEDDFQRLKKQRIAGIQREKSTPMQMALRVFPQLVYGKDHAYGLPYYGSGTEESITGLTRVDLQKFHSTWMTPNNATLVVVGDVTMGELKPQLEKTFSNWKKGKTPNKRLPEVAHRAKSEIYLLDRPGSEQSIVLVGHVAPPKSNKNEIAIEGMNEVLGNSFSSRINMNLREDKHWTYGARSLFRDAKGQRPFFAYSPVQSDKTKETMIELNKELRGILDSRPATQEELDRSKDQNTLSLPGRWETAAAVMGDITDIVRFGYPDNYWNEYPGKVRNLQLADINKAAQDVLRPDNLVWIVVGDLEQIEAGIRELGYGKVHIIDADANPVR